MKTRKFLITINNPNEHGFDDNKIKETLISETTNYMCMCHEVGEQGTPHVHAYVVYQNPREINSIINKFNHCAHIDVSRGSSQENRDYIRKEGKHKDSSKKETNIIDTFYEYGELPQEQQGKRNDNALILELIKDGNTPKEIINEYPQYCLRLKQINTLYELYRWDSYKLNNRDDIDVTFIYGSTGTGKTSYVFNKYGRENVYQVTDYKHPFDNYDGEDVILFDEFRDDIECKEMLKYLDRYPVQLPCRYSNKWACYTKVFIITNIKYSEIYKYVDFETLQAFRRRVNNIIKMNHDREDYLEFKFTQNGVSYKVIKTNFKENGVIHFNESNLAREVQPSY